MVHSRTRIGVSILSKIYQSNKKESQQRIPTPIEPSGGLGLKKKKKVLFLFLSQPTNSASSPFSQVMPAPPTSNLTPVLPDCRTLFGALWKPRGIFF